MKQYTELFGWGDNTYGQLGIGERSRTFESVPRAYSFHIVISAMSCGDYHSLCLSSSGHVYSIGSNLEGRLGIGDHSVSHSYSPCLVKSLSKVSKIACGSSHSLALTSSGEIFSWGLGKYGNLGTGNLASQATPVKIRFPNDLICIQISCGSRTSGVIMAGSHESELYMAGEGSKGQLGNGNFSNESVFVKVIDNVIQVACGYDHTVIINDNYKLLVTGSNSEGQLGLGKVTHTHEFTQTCIEEAIKIAASNVTLCINSQGMLYIAGNHSKGFERIGKGIVFNEVSAGNKYAVMIDSQKTIYEWGNCLNTEGIVEYYGDLRVANGLYKKNIEKIFCGNNYYIALGRILEEKAVNRIKKTRNLSNQFEYIRPKTQKNSDLVKKSNFLNEKYADDQRFNETYRPRVSDNLFFPDFKDRSVEKLTVLYDQERNKNFRLENEIKSLSELVQVQQTELETHRNTARKNENALTEICESKIHDYRIVIDKQNTEIQALIEENKNFKQVQLEKDRLYKISQGLGSENEKLMEKLKELENVIKGLSGFKAEGLSKLNEFYTENLELRKKNNELLKANDELSKRIASYVKDYREKTLDILNAPLSPNAKDFKEKPANNFKFPISPKNLSPLRKSSNISPLTPTKQEIKAKIVALQQNRARIEARLKDFDIE